jgi:hypothetical protein
MRVQLEESIMVIQRIDLGGAAQRVALPRRDFLRGIIGVIAAPAIVRATSLMPVKVWDNHVEWTDLDELALPPRDPAWNITPSFPILRSEDPSEWSESDWRIAKAEAALPPYHRTMAGELT